MHQSTSLIIVSNLVVPINIEIHKISHLLSLISYTLLVWSDYRFSSGST